MEDHKEFEQTAVPHMTALQSYALHLTKNSENAKDLLQDTYLKAYRFWNNFEKGTNVKAWLYQIMKNSFINDFRKKDKEPKKTEYDENRYCHKDFGGQLFDHTHLKITPIDEMFEDEIAHSIESLPYTFKTVILLSDVEELTYSEIARVVACPVGTVRSRLHRGRKVLQKRLSDYAVTNGYISKKSESVENLRKYALSK
jgi:RNA polymerase sigma-70 factor (ECF subfamily)